MWQKTKIELEKFNSILNEIRLAHGGDPMHQHYFSKFIPDYILEDDIEAQADWHWQRWKAQTDTYYLAVEVLGLFSTPTGKKRLDPKLHKKMCRELDWDEDTLQLYPRGHLKSSFISVYSCRRVLANPNVRIGYFSITAGKAETMLKFIKGYFRNRKLRMLFPEFDIDQKEWKRDTSNKMTIFRDESDYVPPEEAIEAWGTTGKVVGNHYDIHIYDDIIDHTSVRTVAQMEKVEEFWSMMQPIKDPQAIDKVIGTTYHHNDIYQKILREKWYEQKNVIIEQVERGGKFLYKYFNMKILKQKTRGMRPYDISCQYYNNPLPTEDQFFIRPYPIYREENAPKKRVYYLAIDPAATTHRYSDSTGISVGFVDASAPRQLFIERAFKCKEPSEKLADLIIDLIVRYNPRRTGIETGLQGHLIPLIQLKMREYEKIKRVPVITKWVPISIGKVPKPDKLNRTVGAFTRDTRMLLRADAHGNYHTDVMDLVMQMEVYNPNFESNEDDVVDSASMLIQTVPNFAPAHWMNVDPEMILTPELEDFIRDRGMAQLRSGKQEKWGWQFAS